MTMRFGGFTALDDVSVRIAPGSFHARLGENGVGKSTLVNCRMGFCNAASGQLLAGGREAKIADPRHADALGLGMVHQHFTQVPSLKAAETLGINRRGRPRRVLQLRQRLLIRRELTKDGWILRFSGPEARKGALLDEVFDAVERMFQRGE